MGDEKSLPQLEVERLDQAAQRQPGSVGGENRLRLQMRLDLAVEIVLPVQALGDGLDDPIALGEAIEMLLVVQRRDPLGELLVEERRRFGFERPCESAL